MTEVTYQYYEFCYVFEFMFSATNEAGVLKPNYLKMRNYDRHIDEKDLLSNNQYYSKSLHLKY